jgi:hypothetical protein
MKTTAMTTPLDDNETDLVKQVIAACHNAITRAIAQPSQAIGLAQGLGSALTSLQLVQQPRPPGARQMPLYSKVSQAYIDHPGRQGRSGSSGHRHPGNAAADFHRCHARQTCR